MPSPTSTNETTPFSNGSSPETAYQAVPEPTPISAQKKYDKIIANYKQRKKYLGVITTVGSVIGACFAGGCTMGINVAADPQHSDPVYNPALFTFLTAFGFISGGVLAYACFRLNLSEQDMLREASNPKNDVNFFGHNRTIYPYDSNELAGNVEDYADFPIIPQ